MKATSFAHILCGVDGSVEACRAARVAAHLAKAFGAKLTFVTVAVDVASTLELDGYKRTEKIDPTSSVALVEDDAEVCLTVALEIASAEGVPNAGRLVRTGEVAEAILSLGAELAADTVVLGHHDRSRMGRAFKAPVSARVADAGGMTVVLVP